MFLSNQFHCAWHAERENNPTKFIIPQMFYLSITFLNFLLQIFFFYSIMLSEDISLIKSLQCWKQGQNLLLPICLWTRCPLIGITDMIRGSFDTY